MAGPLKPGTNEASIMNIRNTIAGWLVPLAIIFLAGCGEEEKKEQKFRVNAIPAINLEHLLNLYLDIELPGGSIVGTLVLAGEYPDYKAETDFEEGFTCVEDVARAMLIDDIRLSEDPLIRIRYERMARFLVHMQAANGYFYNFMRHDSSINKAFRASLAEPNWWSWRAFLALAGFRTADDSLQMEVNRSCKQFAENLFRDYLGLPMEYDTIEGIVVPGWLPQGYAGDQAALVILGLEAYYRNVDPDPRALKLIGKLADGILATQKGGVKQFPFGAYLSWQNIWHAYGNNQAYAMLRAGQLLSKQEYINSALLEIENLYAFLKYEKYLSTISMRNLGPKYEVTGLSHFPQVPYGFRPMIWACTEAYRITRKEQYLEEAVAIARWFSGENYAKKVMYDAETGRCFDGIFSPTDVNLNASAESTVEALLSMQVMAPFMKD